MSPLKDPMCADAERHDDEPVAPVSLPCGRSSARSSSSTDIRPRFSRARSAAIENLAALVTLARVGQWERVGQEGAGQATRPARRSRGRTRRARDGSACADRAGRRASSRRCFAPGRTSDAKRCLDRWREVFAGRHLSIEVQLHHTGGHESALAAELIELAERAACRGWRRRIRGTSTTRGRLVHDMLTALRYGLTIDVAAERGLLHPNGEWRLLSPERDGAAMEGTRGRIARERAHRRGVHGLHARLDASSPARFSQGEARRGHERRDDDEALRVWTDEGARERWGELDVRAASSRSITSSS